MRTVYLNMSLGLLPPQFIITASEQDPFSGKNWQIPEYKVEHGAGQKKPIHHSIFLKYKKKNEAQPLN